MPTVRIVLTCCALLIVALAHAAETRSARLIWSGTDLFLQAKATNALASEPRGTSKIKDQAMPAIFLHPQNAQRTVLTYPPLAVPAARGTRAFLLSFVGISEGFDWQDQAHQPDGVRFYLQYAGQDLTGTYLQESKWAPLAAALGPEGAALADAISLATDAGPKVIRATTGRSSASRWPSASPRRRWPRTRPSPAARACS